MNKKKLLTTAFMIMGSAYAGRKTAGHSDKSKNAWAQFANKQNKKFENNQNKTQTDEVAFPQSDLQRSETQIPNQNKTQTDEVAFPQSDLQRSETQMKGASKSSTTRAKLKGLKQYSESESDSDGGMIIASSRKKDDPPRLSNPLFDVSSTYKEYKDGMIAAVKEAVTNNNDKYIQDMFNMLEKTHSLISKAEAYNTALLKDRERYNQMAPEYKRMKESNQNLVTQVEELNEQNDILTQNNQYLLDENAVKERDLKDMRKEKKKADVLKQEKEDLDKRHQALRNRYNTLHETIIGAKESDNGLEDLVNMSQKRADDIREGRKQLLDQEANVGLDVLMQEADDQVDTLRTLYKNEDDGAKLKTIDDLANRKKEVSSQLEKIRSLKLEDGGYNSDTLADHKDSQKKIQQISRTVGNISQANYKEFNKEMRDAKEELGGVVGKIEEKEME